VFERFSDAARRTVVLAQEQARQLRHDSIGTEHLLLGLLEEDNAAARILREMEVHPAEVRQRVVKVVGKGRKGARGHIPFTPRAKRSLELAAEQSRSVGYGRSLPMRGARPSPFCAVSRNRVEPVRRSTEAPI
jgi:ATP-dependent Clp protease ATP-binding subunit ClpC